MTTKTVADIDVHGKKVLMRVDFNVPLEGGQVTNDKRIQAALPSIRKVLDGGGRLVLMSHLGRPEGKGFEEKYSLAPVAGRLGEALGKDVPLGPKDVVGDEADRLAASLSDGEVALLENLRFQAGETMPDKAKKNPDGKLTAEQEKVHKEFVDALASLGEVYVNDAFGTCHRKHASMYGVPRAIQAQGGPAVAGFLVEKELKYLGEAVTDPDRPFIAILGGAKVSDKIQLISTLLEKVDRILIGGAMAYTLLAARGVEVGDSRVEKDQIDEMRPLLKKAGDRVLLPTDHVATDDFDLGRPIATEGEEIRPGLMGMDIGPETRKLFRREIVEARTVVWNGPMGVFEKEPYLAGTQAVAEAIAEATDRGGTSIIGGGDSAAAVEQLGLEEKMTHVSTGGGASLTFLEGKPMPALETLDQT